MATGYILKPNVRGKGRIFWGKNGEIELDNATQEQLRELYKDYKHSHVEEIEIAEDTEEVARDIIPSTRKVKSTKDTEQA